MKPYKKHNLIMYTLGLFFLSMFPLSTCFGAKALNDSILHVLDTEIDHCQSYYGQKEKQVEGLKQQLQHQKKISEKFTVANKLFEEYITYQYDSAYHYACYAVDIASQLHDETFKNQADINLFHCYVAAGLFKEGAELLISLRGRNLFDNDRFNYYWLCARFYANLETYTDCPSLSVGYDKQFQLYCDSALACLVPDTPEYALMEVFKYHKVQADHKQKINRFHSVIEHYSFLPHDYAILYVLLAKEYKEIKDNDNAIYYTALSALYDIRSATRQITSKTMLGEYLYEKGNVMFASKCMQEALEDANFYNARHRKIEVNSILPIIEYEKNRIIQQQKEKLELYLGILVGFFVILVIFIFIIFKQIKKLRDARQSIQEHCDEVSLVNTRLTEANIQLKQSREKLEEVNEIKDVYIIRFLHGSSEYIERFELLLKKINYKVKSRQYDDLKNLYKEYNAKLERDNLFSSFDSTFLILFPNFIDEYNKLFNPEDHVSTDDNGIFSMELRIFALIRLGFTDIEQIAKFLNLTVKTVYSYKWKVKAKTIVPKEEFEHRIMMIEKIGVNSSKV